MYLQEQKFVGGSQQLSDKLAETLDGSVKLSCPVVSIKQTETEVQLIDKHGRTYTVSMLLSNIQVYSMQHYVIKFVSDLRQVGGFLLICCIPPPIKLTAMI
jgi:monoamine oxidase